MSLSLIGDARRYFDPVAEQFGLSPVEESEQRVRYEGKDVVFTINLDSRRSYEVGVDVRRKGDAGPGYTLGEVLRPKGLDDGGIDGAAAADQSVLQRLLGKLAGATVEHAGDLLAGNEFAFAQLARHRAREIDEHDTSKRLGWAREEAQAAWAAKDHDRVIRALAPFESRLTESERKRLEYARKQRTS